MLRMDKIDTFSDSVKFTKQYPSENNSKNGGAEPGIKLKKLRSVKLSSLPSLKSFKRRSVYQHDDIVADILFTDASNSEQSPTTEETSVQTLTRRSKLKLKKPSMQKSSEGSESSTLISKKFTYSESLRDGDTKSQEDQDSPSANSLSSSHRKKNGSHASPSDFDSSSSSNETNMMHLQRLSTSSTGQKTARKLIRKYSIKPERISASAKARKASWRRAKTPEHPDSGIGRATCSSILKISKVAANKHKVEGIKKNCEELSTGKVCTYSYCSVHGNRKPTEPSLKRFSSMRRRKQNIPKSLRPECSTLSKAKNPANINQTRRKVRNESEDTSTKTCDVIKKMGSNFAVETCARPKVQSKEIGIQTEDIDFSDNENPAQSSLGQVSDISTKEMHTQVTSPVMVDRGMVISWPGIKLEDVLTEPAYIDQKEEHMVAICPGNGHSSSLPCDEGVVSGHCLPAPENLLPPAVLCLNPNDAVGKYSREAPVDGKALLIAKSSSTDIDSDDYSFGSTSSLSETKDVSDVNKAPYKSESLKTEESVEAKPCTSGVGSMYLNDPLEEAATRKEDKGTESELRSSQRHSTLEAPEPDSKVDVAHTWLTKRKNHTLWSLIYQNMVSQLPATNETNLQPHGEEDFERQEKNDAMVLEGNNGVSSQRDSEADQSADVDDEDVGLPQVELTQSDAIKLVEEAINNILLPEVPGIISAVNQEKGLEPNVSTSDTDMKESSADNSNSAEDGRILNIMKINSCRQLSRSWSSVRKIFLLRRFVKTLERIRNFSLQTPQHLPLEVNRGSEKMHLRQHTIEQRKNSDEWMLDYALQLVISKLAPAQKRRVELLIQAYETVGIPPAETESDWNTNAAPSSHEDFVQSYNGSVVRASGETNETINVRTFPTLQEKDISSCGVTDAGKKREPGFGEFLSGSRFSEHGVLRSAHGKEIPVEENVILEVPRNLEVHDTAMKLNNVNSEVTDKTSKRDEAALKTTRLITGDSVKSAKTYMPVSSGSVCDREEKDGVVEHTNTKAEPEIIISLQGLPGSKKHVQSYIHTSSIVDNTQMEKKEQMKLWFMVYRRMLSGLSIEESTEKLLNDAEKKKQVDEYLGSENHEHCKTMESYQAEAIKLVEEAIDGIVLTDSEDQLSDNQSVASYAASDQDLHDDKQSEEDFVVSASVGDMFRESDKVNLKSGAVSNTEGTWKNSREKLPQQQEKLLSKLGGNFNQKTSNHWSRVRKLMRFIKALDKVKKINPRQPRHLPSEAEPGTESVKLKHQEVDDWKYSEDWMLDYAMQKAVAKLTPVRKRKVQMIVEAFETVMPTIKAEAH